MKVFKTVGLIVIVILVTSSIAGYIYFDKKFTPKANYLNIKGAASDTIPIIWEKNDFSPVAGLLLPIKIDGIPDQFYMQFDLGATNTIFYLNSLQQIHQEYPNQLNLSDTDTTNLLKLSFKLGEMSISSDSFKVLDVESSISLNSNIDDIIGTIGADLIENRVAIIDYKNNFCLFDEVIPEVNQSKNFLDFEFKKRKVLLPANIEGKEVKLLFDTGSSAFQLITSKTNWDKYSKENREVFVNNANSWGNTLKTYTTESDISILFGETEIPLYEISYIEGTSFIQNTLMKLSGMQGMIGNKLFLNKTIILDCKNQKYTVF